MVLAFIYRSQNEVLTANQSSDGLSFFNLGILIIIGIYHIILYFQRRRDSGALYFALFCLNLREAIMVQKASSSQAY